MDDPWSVKELKSKSLENLVLYGTHCAEVTPANLVSQVLHSLTVISSILYKWLIETNHCIHGWPGSCLADEMK